MNLAKMKLAPAGAIAAVLLLAACTDPIPPSNDAPYYEKIEYQSIYGRG